jgi:hypothetical protein
MPAKVGLKQVMSGIEDQIKGMLDRSKSMAAYLDRIVYRQYQNAQRQRWITENASEGQRWIPLSANYRWWKEYAFADFPGHGTKMLIATGRLFAAVVGPGGGEHRKTTTDHSLDVGWTTPYAAYVDELRPFADFGPKTMDEIYLGLGEFLMKNIIRDISRGLQ